jgi:hypothetical protein
MAALVGKMSRTWDYISSASTKRSSTLEKEPLSLLGSRRYPATQLKFIKHAVEGRCDVWQVGRELTIPLVQSAQEWFPSQESVWGTDVGNTYLESATQEKIVFVAGEEFGDLAGHLFQIVKALCGLTEV